MHINPGIYRVHGDKVRIDFSKDLIAYGENLDKPEQVVAVYVEDVEPLNENEFPYFSDDEQQQSEI